MKTSNWSLRRRTILSISLCLVLGGAWCLGVASSSMESALRTALENDLSGRLYSLLAVAEYDSVSKRLSWENINNDPVFNRPESGYGAALLNADGVRLWESVSIDSWFPSTVEVGPLGQLQLGEFDGATIVSLGVEWEEGENIHGPWVLVVGAHERLLKEPASAVTVRLLIGFVGVLVFVLLVLWALMVWQWRSADELANELKSLEQGGDKSSIQGSYPIELQALVDRLNGYISHNRHQTKAIQENIENLGHSLKTPLATLRGGGERLSAQDVLKCVDRMNEAIKFFTRKAQANNRSIVVRPVYFKELVNRVFAALQQVYPSQSMQLSNELDDEFYWLIEENDAFEVLGNLMDNAFKYGASHVMVSAHVGSDGSFSSLVIDDDGPGVAPPLRDKILERGMRLDQRVDGQGIGLAMLKSIMEAYGGRIELSESPVGGLRVVLVWLA